MKPPLMSPLSTQTTSSRNRAKVPKDDEWVGLHLIQHGMLIGPRRELDRYPEFKSMVEDIFHSERGSTMKPESARWLVEHRDYYQDANEDTIFQNIIPLILKKDYMRNLALEVEEAKTLEKAMKNAADQGQRTDEELQWVSRERFADGVATTINRDFRRTLLPDQCYAGLDADVVKFLAKEDGMTNPRPDFCYGLRTDKFTVPPDVALGSDVRFLLGVAPGMEHAFFIIEGKSNKGSMGEAHNQARRGGATLVNAGRKLLEYVGEPDVTGAESRTFVYSATAAPGLIEINVHWVEVTQDQTLFHMTYLKSYSLRDEDQLPGLRATLHNSLSWGFIDRLPSLVAFCEKLYTWETNKTARLAALSVESKMDKGKKRQRISEDISNRE